MITLRHESNNKNDDCYFYYYGSGCAKGDLCPFRHEPAALSQEVVCTFWKQGKCNKPHCIFRHMDLDKKRNIIPCYWENTDVGCKKPHCPFLHDKPKDVPLTEPVLPPITRPTRNQYSSPIAQQANVLIEANSSDQLATPINSSNTQLLNMIVNKNKIDELKSIHVIPRNIDTFLPVATAHKLVDTENSATQEKNKRLVLPPKSRLGTRLGIQDGNLNKRPSIKERLGPIFDGKRPTREIYEIGDLGDVEPDESIQEETLLRQSAIRTLDLRNRLSKKEKYMASSNLKSVVDEEQTDSDLKYNAIEPVRETCDSEEDDVGSPSDIVHDRDDDDENVRYGTNLNKKTSKKSKLKKDKKKKKEKRKEHKTFETKIRKVKSGKVKKKKSVDKEARLKAKVEAMEAPIKVSLATKIADEREGKLFSQNVARNKDDYDSSLEIYMQEVKQKKRDRDSKSKQKKNFQPLLINSGPLHKEDSAESQKSHRRVSVDKSKGAQEQLLISKNFPSSTENYEAKSSMQQKSRKRKNDEASSLEPISVSSKGLYVPTTCDNKKTKISKNISDVVEQERSVRSVLNDVDSLLKSAEDQNFLEAESNLSNSAKQSEDVMKQLDEIING